MPLFMYFPMAKVIKLKGAGEGGWGEKEGGIE